MALWAFLKQTCKQKPICVTMLSKLARLSALIGKKYAKQSGVAFLLLYDTRQFINN